jgi:site-specific DNA recombinase
LYRTCIARCALSGPTPGIDPETWQNVQDVLQRNGRRSRSAIRNEFDALLKGLLRCVPCGCAMTPAHTRRGARRYQ